MLPIPLTVVTGFLGAGKTTLLRRWIAQQRDVAVIVNEWGDVGIDGELLGDRDVPTLEIAGGCVCCSSQDELALALAELSESTAAAPKRIFVETSGAASPAGVVRAAVHGPARDRIRLDGIVTVVDGTRLDEVLAFDLAVEQLGFADVVVISHGDATTAAARSQLRAHAPAAVITRAEDGVVQDGDLDALLASRVDAIHLPSTSAHAAFDTVSLQHPGTLDEDRFVDWVAETLGAVEARILRVKGILALTGVDVRVIVQGVGEAVEVTTGAPWDDAPRTSRLVLVGLGLDRPALERGFSACIAEVPEGGAP